MVEQHLTQFLDLLQIYLLDQIAAETATVANYRPYSSEVNHLPVQNLFGSWFSRTIDDSMKVDITPEV